MNAFQLIVGLFPLAVFGQQISREILDLSATIPARTADGETGSGFVIGSDSKGYVYVVTAAHVVGSNPDRKVDVGFFQSRQERDCEVMEARDTRSDLDVALLRCPNPYQHKPNFDVLGNLSELHESTRISLVGNVGGQFTPMVGFVLQNMQNYNRAFAVAADSVARGQACKQRLPANNALPIGLRPERPFWPQSQWRFRWANYNGQVRITGYGRYATTRHGIPGNGLAAY